MRMFKLALLALFVSALAPFAAHAESVDDIVTLSQKNVGEDVILASIGNAKNDFNLTASDIIKLKNANVPNTVITAMLKHHAVAAAPAPAPAPLVAAPAAPPVDGPAPATPPQAAPPLPLEAGEGQLDLENLDTRAWSYRFEPSLGTIWIVPAERTGRIAPNQNLRLSIKTGVYQIRYSGQEKGAKVTVYNNRKSQVLISRVETAQLEAMYVSVFENGEKKEGGRLVVFRDSDAAPQREAQAAVPPTDYVTPAEPPLAYSVPQTTVIYRDPVYVSPPIVYAPGYYYGRPYYYYPRSSVNFGYYHGGHTRVGVGLGFGF